MTEVTTKFRRSFLNIWKRPLLGPIKALYSVWLTKIEASLVGGLNKENEKYI